jgi:hypothetical protein
MSINPETSRHLHVLGLLARPQLSDGQARALRELLAQPTWRPLPRLASTNLLEPLFAHHLAAHGIDFDRVFCPRPHGVLAPPSFVELMNRWAARRRELAALVECFESSELSRVLLFKGAAIAPLYPAPALRQMADIDLAVSPDELAQARTRLSTLGWQQTRSPFAETWKKTGAPFSIDLHTPCEEVASRVLASAMPARSLYEHCRVICVPDTTDHLMLLAVHATDNAGNRIWRDVCDAHALIASGARCPDALERADGTAAREPLEAFLAFIARWCGEASDGAKPASRESRRILAIFEAAALESVSPVELELVGGLLVDTPLALMGRLIGTPAPRSGGPSTAVERDPRLGTLPPRGSWARHRMRLTVLGRTLFSAQLPRVVALAFRQARIRKNRRLFDTPPA